MNYHELINKYNEEVDEDEAIYNMDELYNYLIDYGYEEDEIDNCFDDTSLFYTTMDDLFERDKFNINDEYFWQDNNSGYLYSGSAEVAYASVIGNNNIFTDDDISSNDNDEKDDAEYGDIDQHAYRIEININGQNYGFLKGIDVLIESGKISEDDEIINLAHALFSKLPRTNSHLLPKESRFYFTEFGYQRFKQAIDIMIKRFKSIDVECNIIETTIPSEEIVWQDKYQLVKK